MKRNITKLLIVLAALLLSPVVGAATYTYDGLNRLTSVTYRAQSAIGDRPRFSLKRYEAQDLH